MIIMISSVFVLLCLSAFFSGSETALTGASPAYMRDKEKNESNSRAKTINKLFKKRDTLIITTLMGSNLANTLATSLATSVLIGLFGNEGIAYATVVMTVLVLIYTDMLPKTYAVHNANKMSLVVAPVIAVFVKMFSPFVYILQKIVKLAFMMFGLHKIVDNKEDMAVSEIRGAIDMYDGLAIKEEKDMLKGILDLTDLDVYDVMTHRKNMVCFDIRTPVEVLVKEVQSTPFSRIPLYEGAVDNIVGVLIVKNFLKEYVNNKDKTQLDLRKIMIAPWFIPENTNLLNQMKEFRNKREHFAIVIDEYGDIEGVVTLEDIIEEIVGDIDDENDYMRVRHADIKQVSENVYIVDGEIAIRDLNRQNGWDIDDENMATIAGYLIDMARTIPSVGEKFIFEDFKFEVLQRDKNQISKLKITRLY